MRKILVVIIAMLLLPLRVYAGESDTFATWNLDMSVVAHQVRNGEEHMTNLAMWRANDKIAYCIEPGVVGDNEGWYSSSYDINDTNLKNIDTKMLSLIGYYGYGYGNHNTKEYYMAAQELIWRLAGVEDVWWTDKKYGGNVLNVEKQKQAILKLVESYEVAPNFRFNKKYIVGDEIILPDTNNVLDGYEVKEGNVVIDGNNIKIKVTEDTKFTLMRKTNGLKPIYYYKDGYQSMASFEYAYDFEKEYRINSSYGKIIVDKYDNDTKSKIPISKDATLTGASYAIYHIDGTFIKEDKTDENGIIVFDNLEKGVYIIRETNPSEGYLKEQYSCETYVASDDFEAVCKRYEKIIKNEFIIEKLYEKNNEFYKEKGTTFGVYDNEGNLINEYKTDNEGKIYLTLPYGKYFLKQLSTKEGYDIVEDTYLEIIEYKKTPTNITLVNKKLREEVKEQTNEVIEELPNTSKSINYFPYILIHLFLIRILKNEKEST